VPEISVPEIYALEEAGKEVQDAQASDQEWCLAGPFFIKFSLIEYFKISSARKKKQVLSRRGKKLLLRKLVRVQIFLLDFFPIPNW